jgi:hypothetical protein
MNKWGYLAIAGIVGAAAGAVYNYLFAPAPETTFDDTYQSRLDWALAEGEKAAAQREIELRAEFEAAKYTPPALPLPPSISDYPSSLDSGI